MTRLIYTFACVLLFAALIRPALAADRETGQLCWAVGKFDDAVYFAGIEGREDRSASFKSLIEISGVEAFPVRCKTLPVADYRDLRARLVRDWKEMELEVIDTTFMSDLDY
jgi:hypothetical protein